MQKQRGMQGLRFGRKRRLSSRLSRLPREGLRQTPNFRVNRISKFFIFNSFQKILGSQGLLLLLSRILLERPKRREEAALLHLLPNEGMFHSRFEHHSSCLAHSRTLERDEDCDKTLADHLEDIYFDLLGRMDKLAPLFLAQFAKKKDTENEEREFRKKGKFKK